MSREQRAVSSERNMREPIKSYQDLMVWKRSIDLVEAVYRASSTWPSDERFGLTSQVRRASVSIPANIAEGHGRLGDRELARYLSIARGSLREVETHLIIARRLNFLSDEEFDQLHSITEEVGRLLFGLYRRVQQINQTRIDS